MLGNGRYYLEYPEDIRLYGLSFSTTLPTGTAWAGEISYRPNLPLQINTTDMTLSLLNPITNGATALSWPAQGRTTSATGARKSPRYRPPSPISSIR